MRVRRTGLVPRPQFVRDARIFVIAVEGEKTEALAELPGTHVFKVVERLLRLLTS